jgi:hypothetical protein
MRSYPTSLPVSSPAAVLDTLSPAPECVALPRKLSDDTLVVVLSIADEGDPRGYLHGLGVARDALPVFAMACVAEVVARLDTCAA